MKFENLPDGHFIRVKEHTLNGPYPWVQLRKKLRWFGSVCIDEAWTPQEFESYEVKIELIANNLIERYWANREYEEEEKIIGDFYG